MLDNKLNAHSNLIFPALIQANVSLAEKNWFRTGGPAQFFAEPTSSETFAQALSFAHEQNLPITMIGSGANMLISDEGVEGLVIRPKLTHIRLISENDTHALIEAGAGVVFEDLITWCLKEQLIGLEEFSGIPGTVGGSVFINIHYFEFLLSNFISSAQVIHKATGTLETVPAEWFEFGYNYSRLHHGEYYLISATFSLKKVTQLETAFAQGRSREITRHRYKRYPATHTCGSFFRNFLPQEVAETEKKLIFVAYYLDKIGIKGELCIGDAIVSHQHANMIVNRGTATSSDIIAVAREMQRLVYTHFNLMPQPECRLIGFKHYPLLS